MAEVSVTVEAREAGREAGERFRRDFRSAMEQELYLEIARAQLELLREAGDGEQHE